MWDKLPVKFLQNGWVRIFISLGLVIGAGIWLGPKIAKKKFFS